MSAERPHPWPWMPTSPIVCPEIITSDNRSFLHVRPNDPLMDGRRTREVIPPWLTDLRNQRLMVINETLLDIQTKIVSYPSERLEDETYRRHKTVEAVYRLFPDLKAVSRSGAQETLFKGRRLPEYVNEVALPMAKGFREWVIKNHLPESFWQPLELLEEVNNAGDFLDLVRLCNPGSSGIGPFTEETNKKMAEEVKTLLGLMYVASIVDLSRRLKEEVLLRDFYIKVLATFRTQENIRLLIKLDKEGKFELVRVCGRKGEDLWQTQQVEISGDFDIDHTYTVRRFGSGSNDIVIVQEREKDPYSEMLKVIRSRQIPVHDRQGARFILGHQGELDPFLKLLKKSLSDWQIEPEETVTPSPETELTYAVKYYAYRKEQPDIRIEIQIDWLLGASGVRGSWIEKRYESGRCFEAYRMKQLLKTALPILCPYGPFPFDWSDGKVQEELYAYANYKAQH